MEPRKFESKKRYIISIIIGTVLFLLIFAVSYSISYLELQRVSNLQVGVGYSIFEDKLQYSLFEAQICNSSSFEKVSKDLAFQGRIIDDLEQKMGKQNKDVLLRKKFYALIELEHFEFVSDLNKKCGNGINTILFFYSNDASQAKESEDAGKILGIVASKNEDLIIYSFDVNLDSELITSLKEKYNVTETPSIVINEKPIILVPDNISDIEAYINQV